MDMEFAALFRDVNFEQGRGPAHPQPAAAFEGPPTLEA
jgi:hypothetical protein